MTKPNIQIGNETREMTNAEFTQWQADAAEAATQAAAIEAKASARSGALAKLKALGLTDAEVAALVGG